MNDYFRMYPLSFVDEGGQVVIGRPEIDSFAVFPPPAAAVLRHLERGESLAQVSAWYQAEYGEPADLADFVATLRELDFIRPGAAGTEPTMTERPVRWRRLGAATFCPAALAFYAAAVGAAIYLMAAVPVLRPGPSKVFFSRSIIAVLAVTFTAQLAGIAWHEGFHVLAGRRLGLPSKLSISSRLYYIVFQTTLVGLMGVPGRRRILPFCAGLIADALYVSVLIGLAEAGREAGWAPWLGRTAVGLAYLTMLRMLWQFMLFMETDMCHVLASALRCPDLHGMTRQYLRNRYASLRGRRELAGDESGWSARDMAIARRYAPFVLAGSGLLLVSGAIGTIPVLAGLLVRVYHGLLSRSFASPWFWDSTVAGLAVVAQFAVVAWLRIRSKRTRSRAAGSG
jgi:hypothetical protein